MERVNRDGQRVTDDPTKWNDETDLIFFGVCLPVEDFQRLVLRSMEDGQTAIEWASQRIQDAVIGQ